MKRAFFLIFATGLLAAGVAAFTARPSMAHPRCYRVSGSLRAAVAPTGCTSPVGLCTAGEFQADHLLRGTTSFVADALAPAAPAVEPASTLSYSGLLTITTRYGTLTTRDTGIFDTAAGLFASRDVIVSGTGIFAGATGHLFFTGTGTTSFDSDASGEICFAR